MNQLQSARCPLAIVVCLAVGGGVWCVPAVAQLATAVAPAAPASDPVRMLQCEAEVSGEAAWGHWGDQPERYVSWSNHSNRLIPVYTFGLGLDAVGGANSVYRDESRLAKLYGRLPDQTHNPAAAYFDQTDVHQLQLAAAEAGKKYIVLVVFDGLDWTMTQAAAIATTGHVAYSAGRGAGFAFQDYRGCPTDFGLCVTSPANDGTKTDVDAQAVKNPGGKTPGGYDASRGGATAWQARANLTYLIGRDRDRPHAVTDSAAIRPLEALVRNRTSSMKARVGPAVSRIVAIEISRSSLQPYARRGGCPASTRSIRAAISSGSAIRPVPSLRQESQPLPGGISWTPSAASRSTFRWTAGFAHIAAFIAGATSTGHSAHKTRVVSRSSAAPCAALARKSAEAGATTIRSARAVSSMWAPSGYRPGSKLRVATGRPVSAAKVATPMNFRALLVTTAVTPTPRWTSMLARAAAL